MCMCMYNVHTRTYMSTVYPSVRRSDCFDDEKFLFGNWIMKDWKERLDIEGIGVNSYHGNHALTIAGFWCEPGWPRLALARTCLLCADLLGCVPTPTHTMHRPVYGPGRFAFSAVVHDLQGFKVMYNDWKGLNVNTSNGKPAAGAIARFCKDHGHGHGHGHGHNHAVTVIMAWSRSRLRSRSPRIERIERTERIERIERTVTVTVTSLAAFPHMSVSTNHAETTSVRVPG